MDEQRRRCGLFGSKNFGMQNRANESAIIPRKMQSGDLEQGGQRRCSVKGSERQS
jgi:hypothetical protein